MNQLKNKIEINEARFKAIAQTASDSILISNENSIIVFANRKAYEVFGYTEGTLIGADLGGLMPEKYRQGHKFGVKRFINSGNPKLIGHTIEIEGLRKDGTVFPLELSLSGWKEGESYLFSGIIRDISERKASLKEKEEATVVLQKKQKELEAANEELKAAEEELRSINDKLEQRVETRTVALAESERRVKRSEEKLRLITNAVPVLISYLRNDYTYEFVNSAYEKLFRVKSNEIIGKPVYEIIGEKAFNNVKPQLERVFNGEFVETEVLQDYGEAGKKWVRVSLIPHAVQNKVVGAFALVEDITRFKVVQQQQEELILTVKKANKEKGAALKQLKRKNQELERINNDLDNFIYAASHDLKAPISNIEGLMSLLKNAVYEKVEAKEKKILDMVDSSISKLQKTISDLVEITKVQKGLEEEVKEPLRIVEVASDVKDDIYSLIQESNVTLKEDYKVEEIAYKISSLRSILYNLLSNAIKYRRPGVPVEVEIKTFSKGDFTVLAVKDNGLGLSPGQQKKLFNLFTRLHKNVEGTGVGLFMVKRIVDNSGGRIEVESEEGKGTTFYVYLRGQL